MAKRAITTNRAPAPGGPYSQGVVMGDWIFVAGQGGFDPADGSLPDGVVSQAEQAFQNVGAILEEAQATLSDVVKVSVFLSDLADAPQMNEVFARLMPAPPPVRTTVEAGLAPGMRIEIDAIALQPS